MTAKERHRIKMLEYWGDPENDFINRSEMCEVLGISGVCLYKHFTVTELNEIESEAVELRKKYSARQRAAVLNSLFKESINGSVSAAKEFLDRTEGKVVDKAETNNNHRIIGTWKKPQ